MFKEQYHRDNEKLHVKETLLMEIKKKQAGEAPRPWAERRKSSFVRYGAAAAAAVLVVGGVLGAVLAGARVNAGPAPAEGVMAAAADSTAAQEAAPAAQRRALQAESDSVRAMNSYDELYELFEQMRLRDAAVYGVDTAVLEDAGMPEATAEGGAGANASSSKIAAAETPQGAAEGRAACLAGDFSETNTQVRGVDEADIVKTDGRYIYYVANNQLNILEAGGSDTKLVSSTQFANNDKWWGYASEMFLQGNRLMIITQGYAAVWTRSANGGYDASREQTQVVLYDVSNPARPREVAALGQSGNYVSSRMIGEYVYLVTSHYVWQPVREQPATYVPELISGGTAKAIAASDILVYGTPTTSAYTVIGAVNLVSGTDYATAKAVFGGAGDVYCNTEHLLLTNGEYNREVGDVAPDVNGKNVQVTTGTSQTRLLLFDLDGEKITLTANATIPGTLINQFAVDESNAVFRLVTTCNNSVERIYTDGVDTYDYESETYNCLYTLDAKLDMLGRLERLAEDEWIESVRFDGNIGYFVTFRQVDPLFAVDLSNPRAPKVLGELKIPGFSEYLHVYGDGLLLGLGYEADESTGATKGVKLSMFDVKNPRSVRELTTERIGADWTAVGGNHKAILVSVEKNLIAFPADSAYYIFSYTREKGFEQLAKVRMDDGLNSWNLRGLFIGDYFYVLGDAGVTVISMRSWEKAAHCTIPQG